LGPGFVDALFALTAVAYGVASVIYLAHLMGNPKVAAAVPWAGRLLAVATVAHAGHVVLASYVFHVCPVKGLHFAMSLLSVVLCTTFLFVRRRWRIEVAGAFVAPFALTFLVGSRFVGTEDRALSSVQLRTAILPLHVAANVLGEALFVLAAATAVLYLVEERRLKTKKLAGLFVRLPPLDALERAEHRFLLLGFPLFTIGILTGTLWAPRVESGSAADLWRAAFGYTSWLVFAAVLLLRAAGGWRGRRAAYGTICGFGFSLLVLLVYLLRSTHAAVAVAELSCR
jgi:ABC-type uncharacterized transport system permease subunit